MNRRNFLTTLAAIIPGAGLAARPAKANTLKVAAKPLHPEDWYTVLHVKPGSMNIRTGEINPEWIKLPDKPQTRQGA